MNEAPPFSNPLVALAQWYAAAKAAGAREPEAMTLATVGQDGRPSARVVLYKGQDAGRVQFVSNYESRKGRDIERNPEVALVFFWPESMRQVRIEGRAEKAPDADSDSYFRTRARESQLGAWASAQSEVIESRAVLEELFRQAEARYAGRDVPRPPHWGLYSVTPRAVELWISGEHRLHDRFWYSAGDGGWSVVRLSP